MRYRLTRTRVAPAGSHRVAAVSWSDACLGSHMRSYQSCAHCGRISERLSQGHDEGDATTQTTSNDGIATHETLDAGTRASTITHEAPTSSHDTTLILPSEEGTATQGTFSAGACAQTFTRDVPDEASREVRDRARLLF